MIAVRFPSAARPLPAAIRARITKCCAATGDALLRWLPELERGVTLHAAIGPRVIPSLGYGATALDRNNIVFTLADTPPEILLTIVDENLRPALFHESHHLVRGWVRQGGERDPSFIHGVICEGLASVFERDAAGRAPPWCQYPDDVGDWVAELLELPARADYRQWMFQHPDGRRWIGYRAGTYIAERAIAHSGRDAAQLVRVPCRRILELAGLPPPRHGPFVHTSA